MELLALGAIARGGKMHGFEVVRWIDRTSGGDLIVEEGALYPALHRMEERGWLDSVWAISDRGRRAKYYSVTRRGERALAKADEEWRRYVAAVRKVVRGKATA
jgi:transcriptional regulator